MASPSPRPWWVRLLDESACRKRSKTWGRNAGSMPGPLSSTVRRTWELIASSRTWTRPAFSGTNLIALESEVPDDLLQPARVAGDRARAPGSRIVSRRTRLAWAAGRSVSRAASITTGSSTDRTSRRSLPATMRETSRMSAISWVWTWALRWMVSTALRRISGEGVPLAQDVGPSHDRVERRPQLVRQDGQELVLAAVRLHRRPVEHGVVDGDGGAQGEVLGHPKVARVVAPLRVRHHQGQHRARPAGASGWGRRCRRRRPAPAARARAPRRAPTARRPASATSSIISSSPVRATLPGPV